MVLEQTQGNDAPDIIVSGHLCIDVIPGMAHVTKDALTIPGHLSETEPLLLATGGAVSNVGQDLYRLGVNVGLMGVVGDDPIGGVIVDVLRRRDPALTRLIKVQAGQPSSYTIVLQPQNADRTFLHCPATNDTFGLADLDFALIGRAKIFHLGYPPLMARLMQNDGDELVEIYRRAKERGVITSLDMARPDPNGVSGRVNWAKLLPRVLPYVDIFVPSIEEMLFMIRRADFEAWQGSVLAHLTQAYLHDLASQLLAMGSAVVGFKLSEMGVYLLAGDRARLARLSRLPLNLDEWANAEVWHPAFQVEVAGTTGSGDAAYAGLLAAMLRGMSPQASVRWACAIGSCCVEAADATSGVRSWEGTQARLDAGWAVRPERLPA